MMKPNKLHGPAAKLKDKRLEPAGTQVTSGFSLWPE